MRRISQILYKACIISGLVCITSACEDFLLTRDPSNFSTNNYYTKPAHAESAVIAVYQSLSSIVSAAWMMTEFQTGTANTELGDPPNYLIRNLNNSPDNSYSQTYWVSHYRGIANANVALEKIPGIEMDETRKKQLLGEVHFLRAYYYFNLVRLFGNIPLLENSIDLTSKDLYPEQATVESVYNVIVNDLKIAESAGLPFKDEGGRVSTGAIKSLLANVYLTMAGFPLNKGTEYYTLARDKAGEVISSGQFRLFDQYSDLHNKATDNKGEHIFMIQFDEFEQPSNAVQSAIVPYKRNISLFSSEIGAIYAQTEFVGSYEEDDKRVNEKEFFYTTFTLAADRSKSINLGAFFIYKLFDYEAHTVKIRTGLNWPLIRFADVLLTYSEASNEVSGPNEAAYEALNKIRIRARLPQLSGLGQSAFREAIWRERFYETCFENKIWFDMARLRKAFNFKTRTFNDYVGHTFPYGVTLSERELLFPIPSAELRDNPNLQQNKGY